MKIITVIATHPNGIVYSISSEAVYEEQLEDIVVDNMEAEFFKRAREQGLDDESIMLALDSVEGHIIANDGSTVQIINSYV